MAGNAEKKQAFFIQLVDSLYSSAWIMLGKIANPMTGREEINLEVAKANIEMLSMLKDKTKGNLSKFEDDLLSNVLQQLQLNYADVVSKSKEKKAEEKKIKSD